MSDETVTPGEFSDLAHEGHSEAGAIAHHVPWDFRPEALVYNDPGRIPLCPNFHPIGTEFHNWLIRKGHFRILSASDKGFLGSYTNPYSYHASCLSTVLHAALNDGYGFSTSSASMDPLDAEIARVRYYNEQVLYGARLCEALIKQLLYLTQIKSRYYARAALGGLLSVKCHTCGKSAKKSHRVSLLGSLAHRYGLCVPIEECAAEHLRIANRLRNKEAAHAEAQDIRVRTADESRAELHRDSVRVGTDLVHILRHIGELEQRINQELMKGPAAVVGRLLGLDRVVPPLETASSTVAEAT